MSFLKVNHILDSSSVQGPGKRFTVWVQGCSLHCHGCQNTDTWDQFKSTLELVQKTIKFKNIFLCTGYKFNLIIGHDVFHEILDYVDIICSGPFDESKICRSKWKGSDNQEVRYITDRGKELLKLPVYKTEYRIDKTTGNTLVTANKHFFVFELKIMEITEIRISISDDRKIKAYASITLDDLLVIHGIKILDGRKGVFIAMPSKRSGEKFKDIVHPLNTDFRNQIQEKILSKYTKMIQEESVCQIN